MYLNIKEMNNISKETRAEMACQMALMDAIERGLTTSEQAVAFMASETFDRAAKSYLEMINKQF